MNKPLTSLTAADCAAMGRAIIKSGDKFVSSMTILPQGLTPEVCKSGKAYAAAVNEAMGKEGLCRMFTKKGKITQKAKGFLEMALEYIGLKPNASSRQAMNRSLKIIG